MTYHYIHIINSLDTKYGGPPIALSSLVKAQKKNGNKVTIISTFITKKEFNSVQSDFKNLIDNNIEFILLKAFSFYRVSLKLISILIKNNHEAIFYFHGIYRWPTTIGSYICRIKNYKYVIRLHGALDPYLFNKSVNGKVFFIFKKISEKIFDFKNLKKAMWVHVTSKNELKKLPNYCKVNCNLKIIPNGISLPEKNNFVDIRKKYNLNKKQKIILFLGRISEKKGLDLLINSYPLLNRRLKNTSLLIIGPDNENYIRELRKIIKRIDSSISKNIIFDQKVSRSLIKSYFTQSDLFVLPSHTENFGMAVIESIYYGTPTLVSKNVDIFQELKKHRLLNTFEKLNPEDISNKIIDSLYDSNLKKALNQNGKNIIKKMYSWTKISDDIQKLTNYYIN